MPCKLVVVYLGLWPFCPRNSSTALFPSFSMFGPALACWCPVHWLSSFGGLISFSRVCDVGPGGAEVTRLLSSPLCGDCQAISGQITRFALPGKVWKQPGEAWQAPVSLGFCLLSRISDKDRDLCGFPVIQWSGQGFTVEEQCSALP